MHHYGRFGWPEQPEEDEESYIASIFDRPQSPSRYRAMRRFRTRKEREDWERRQFAKQVFSLLADEPPPRDQVLVSEQMLRRAEAALEVLLDCEQVRQHRAAYDVLKSAYMKLGDMFALVIQAEDPSWLDALTGSLLEELSGGGSVATGPPPSGSSGS